MKRDLTKNLKVLLTVISMGVSSITNANSIVPKDSRVTSDTELEVPNDMLYGAAIDECQVMSNSWKEVNQLDFTLYMKKELAKAAEDTESRLFEDSDENKGVIEVFYKSQRNTYKKYISLSLEELNQELKPASAEDLQDLEKNRLAVHFKTFMENRETAVTVYNARVKKALDKIKGCIALHTVISNAPKARGMAHSEFNKSQKASSFDGKVNCSSVAYETQDYKACKEASKYYDAVFLGRKAVETAQSFQYMDKTMDIQTEFAKNAQTDAAAGLRAQKSEINEKADMARTRAATEAAAVGALYYSMQKFPTLEDLGQECKEKVNSLIYTSAYEKAYDEYKGKFTTLINNIGLDSTKAQPTPMGNFSGVCNTHIYNTGQSATHALIQNEEVKETIKQALIEAGVNIATMLGTAAILDKQADRVGDAIKLVDDHEPESLAYDSEDILATECQVDPGSENCVNPVYERGVGFQNDGISVNGMQFATSDSTLPIDETTRNSEAAGNSTYRGNSVGGMGAPIDSIDKAGGLADSPTGAASVSSTGSNGIGSGGGGGGSGGGGVSAPANGSARTGGDGAKKPYVGSSKGVKYSGGSGLSFSSGAKRRAPKAKAENPFSNLFGKKGASKNGVLNFRGVASGVGSKNGSIFQMISNRYSTVNKEKRLEEYQKVNK